MVLKIARKGVLFTMVSIIMSSIVLAAFFFSQAQSLDKSVISTQTRIDSINNYLDQLESYISSQIQANTRIALLNMTRMMIDKDDYFTNPFEEELNNCLKTKKVNEPVTDSNVDCGTNLQEKLAEMDALALNELNINSTMTLTDINIYQVTPWSVNVDINVNVSIKDGYAEWEINNTYKGKTSIIGLSDPTYSVNVDGSIPGADRYPNNITTPDPWNGWVRYPSRLNILALSKEYFQFDRAPNYLSRMNGNLNAQDGSTGIASLVITAPFDPFVSNLDFTFWSQNACVDGPHQKFDFFSGSVNAQERAKLNISETGLSIHSMIVPDSLLVPTNMSDVNYYVGAGC